MLGSLILYLQGMRVVIFQLSGFYYKTTEPLNMGLGLRRTVKDSCDSGSLDTVCRVSTCKKLDLGVQGFGLRF